jgi:hypothetical protein
LPMVHRSSQQASPATSDVKDAACPRCACCSQMEIKFSPLSRCQVIRIVPIVPQSARICQAVIEPQSVKVIANIVMMLDRGLGSSPLRQTGGHVFLGRTCWARHRLALLQWTILLFLAIQGVSPPLGAMLAIHLRIMSSHRTEVVKPCYRDAGTRGEHARSAPMALAAFASNNPAVPGGSLDGYRSRLSGGACHHRLSSDTIFRASGVASATAS